VHLEQLYRLALGLNLLDHLLIDYGLEGASPVVVAVLFATFLFVWGDHAVQKYLDDDEEVLVGEEHEIFEAGIDGGFGWRVDVWAGVREKVEELDEAADSKSFKFLCSQKGLSEVYILNDL